MLRSCLTASAKHQISHSTNPRRSSVSADVTTTALITPSVSTRLCRLRPLIFLWPSKPMALFWLAVLILCESILPAEGSSWRPKSIHLI
jgi:hypothetical protein